MRWLCQQSQKLRLAPGADQPRIGLIFHFIKQYNEARKPPRRHADPRASAYATRYGRWFWDQRTRVGALTQALEQDPRLLLILRGVDVASHELAIPTWPLRPLFDRARAAGDRAAARLAQSHPDWQVEGLRATAHVGEEFSRLVQGLRRIHETVEFGLLRVGDRIGHGLALGWDPRVWAQDCPCVVQSVDERLDDLAWELERYQRAQVEVRGERVEFVKAELGRLGRQVYGERAANIDVLLGLRRDRFDTLALERLDYPRPARRIPAELALLHTYLSDPSVYLRGAALMEVGVEELEVEFLIRARTWLCQQLERLSITIESNPSSNLLIGDFDDLRAHPTLRLAPLPGDQEQSIHLPVSINSDDPLTFATCLADEYAHMYFALIASGLSSADALSWLDRARQAGWRSCFTLPASAERSCLEALVPPW